MSFNNKHIRTLIACQSTKGVQQKCGISELLSQNNRIYGDDMMMSQKQADPKITATIKQNFFCVERRKLNGISFEIALQLLMPFYTPNFALQVLEELLVDLLDRDCLVKASFNKVNRNQCWC